MKYDEEDPAAENEGGQKGPTLVYCTDPLAVNKAELQLFKLELLFSQGEFSSLEEASQYAQQFIGKANIPFKPSTPFDEALGITLKGFDKKGVKSREKEAKKAVEICPDGSLAWVLLAESVDDDEEAERLFREGIAAGERFLGKNFLLKKRPEAWAIRSRGYMRALAGLFFVYLDRDEKRAAARLGLDMLRCNPTDNQGMRMHLASLLLETTDYPQLAKLLRQYRFDHHPHLRYAELLYFFRTLGDHHKTHRSLAQALQSNGFVPNFLLGEWAPEDYFTLVVETGSEEEAADYYIIGETSWDQSPRAIEWLYDTLNVD